MKEYEYSTLRDFILDKSNTYASRTAIQYHRSKKEIVSVTYGELKKDIESLGTYLINKGYDGRRHIAIVSENSYDWIRLFFAIAFSGNVCVPISKDLGPEIIAENLKNVDCSVVFYSKKTEKLIRSIIQADESVITEAYPMADLDSFIKEGTTLIRNGNISFASKKVLPDDVAAIFFTSGTTGSQKGVMLTQNNFAYNLQTTAERLHIAVQRHMLLLVLPLTHTLSFHSLCDIFHFGSTLFVCKGIKYLFSDMESSHPDITCMVPLFMETVHKEVMNELSAKGMVGAYNFLCAFSNMLLKVGIDLRPVLFKKIRGKMGGNLKTIISGGAAIDQSIIEEFHTWGIDVAFGYGLTECAPSISFCEYVESRAGSVGRVLNGLEVNIDNPDDKGIGEVCVKGPVVMKGYYKRPDDTAEALRNGVFHTGDLGYLDKDGFLFLTGRSKNLIILSNGENVSPEMLENRLGRHGVVKEVVAYQDENVIVAEIFPDTRYVKQNGIDNVKRYCEECVDQANKGLPAYARISKVVIRDTEFQKNASGKIVRSTIGEM